MDGPIRPTPSFLLQPRFISVHSAQQHTETQNIFLQVRGDFSRRWSISSAQPDSSLLPAGRNQETPVTSPSQTPQSGGFCPDWPLGWGVWRLQDRRGLEPWCGHGEGQAAQGGDRVRALAMGCHQMLDKNKN